MPTADTSTTPQADAITVNELAARVAKLERGARRWRTAFAALAVLMVGVAADSAVKESVEFGTVKAKAFEVIGSEGIAIGSFTAKPNSSTGVDESYLLLSGERKQRATFVYAGREPKIVDQTAK